MKSVLIPILFLVIIVYAACFPSRELQIEKSVVELQKVDTLYRADGSRYKYTWFDQYNKVEYTEFLKDTENELVGNKKYIYVIK